MSVNPKGRLQEHFQQLGLPLPTYDSSRAGGQDHIPLWSCTVTLFDGSVYSGEICSSRKDSELSAAEKALYEIDGKTKHSARVDIDFGFKEYKTDLSMISRRKDLSGTKNKEDNITNKNSKLTVDEWFENLSMPSSIKVDFRSETVGLGFKKAETFPNSQDPLFYFYREEKNKINGLGNSENCIEKSNKPSTTHLFVDVENKPKLADGIMERFKNKEFLPTTKITLVMARSFAAKAKYTTTKGEESSNISSFVVEGNAGFSRDAADIAIMLMASRVPVNCTIVILSGDHFANTFSNVCNFIDEKEHVIHICEEKELLELIDKKIL